MQGLHGLELKGRERNGPELGGRKTSLGDEAVVESAAMRGILGGQRTASDQVAGLALQGIADDFPPEHRDHGDRAMIAVDAGAPQLHEGLPVWLERREIKFAGAVVSEMESGHRAGLHAVGSHHSAGTLLDDDQVIADLVELILIHARRVRAGQPLVELQIEDLEAQPQGGADLIGVTRKTNDVGRAIALGWNRGPG